MTHIRQINRPGVSDMRHEPVFAAVHVSDKPELPQSPVKDVNLVNVVVIAPDTGETFVAPCVCVGVQADSELNQTFRLRYLPVKLNRLIHKESGKLRIWFYNEIKRLSVPAAVIRDWRQVVERDIDFDLLVSGHSFCEMLKPVFVAGQQRVIHKLRG